MRKVEEVKSLLSMAKCSDIYINSYVSGLVHNWLESRFKRRGSMLAYFYVCNWCVNSSRGVVCRMTSERRECSE